jgi:hypothetical protein
MQAETEIWYTNHFEACYCVEGVGEIKVLGPEPKTYPIEPGQCTL